MISSRQQYSQQFPKQSLTDNNRTSSLFSFSQNKKIRGFSKQDSNLDPSNLLKNDQNDSYYDKKTKQYQHSPCKKQDGLSDLSMVIYEGLDQAKKQVQKYRLLANIENIYKKNIQLQIELCKQVEKLTRFTILFNCQNQFKTKACLLEQEIISLKKQMYQLQNKMNLQNQSHNVVHHLKTKAETFYNTPKNVQFFVHSIEHKSKSKNKNRRKQYQSQEDKSFNQNTFHDQTSKLELPKKKVKRIARFQQSEYSSVSPIPSRGASILTGKKIGTCSTTPNSQQQKKMLLFQRRNIIKAQIQLSRQNLSKKVEMIKTEMQLMQEQMFLVDEQLEKYDNLVIKDQINSNKYIRSTEKSHERQQRNPRLQSYERLRKEPKYKLFSFKNKAKSPMMFLRARAGNNSPFLTRCRSENKLKSHMMFIPQNISGQQLKSSNIKSNMPGQVTYQQNQYFEQSMNGLAAVKYTKITNNKAQNLYYS